MSERRDKANLTPACLKRYCYIVERSTKCKRSISDVGLKLERPPQLAGSFIYIEIHPPILAISPVRETFLRPRSKRFSSLRDQ